MRRISTTLIRSSLAAALVGGIPALGADQTIRAEVQHPVATPYRMADPDVAAFKLKFGIRLTNRSEKPVNLPKSETSGDETTRAAIISVQSKRPDGIWKYVVQSSWYDDGRIKYAPCLSLPPGGTAEIGNLQDGIVSLKKQLADLIGESTIRFGLWLFCKQPDGKILMTSVMTDAFALRLPEP